MVPSTKPDPIQLAAEHYRQYRNAFISWARNEFGVGTEEAKDAFQEAVCIFHEQQFNGRFDGPHGNVRAYLFSIGRHKLLSHLRSKKIHGNHLNGYAIHMEGHQPTAHDQMERNEDLEKVRRELEMLLPDDRRVLQLYYVERMDMRAIAEAMGYKNANVAKKKKCIALKRLMDQMKKVMTVFLL
jgi:RNA polymerase sigma-70 factor (ECF subfamily)